METTARILFAATLTSLLGALTLPVFTISSLALPLPCSTCNYHGAPGPIVGAGLPMLAIGYGTYWLVKRRRKGS